MSCRTTPAGSAFTSFARIASGTGAPLSDVATLSTFHALRRHGQQMIRDEEARGGDINEFQTRFLPYPYHDMPLEEAYARMLAGTRQQILNDQGLTEARRASLLARMDAATTAQTPDLATLYALAALRQTISHARDGQASFLGNVAETLGITHEEALARFRELEDSIDRNRSAEDPETYTEANRAAVRRAGLPDEPGVVHAYVTLTDRARAVVNDVNSTRPRLISNHTRIAASPVPGTTLEVVGYGVDERTRRMEVITRDTVTGEETIHAYREGNSNDINGFSGTYQAWRRDPQTRSWSGQQVTLTPGEYFGDHVRTSYRQYSNEAEAQAAGIAGRCALCGQFATAGHSCPDRFAAARVFNLNPFERGTAPRTSRQKVTYQGLNRDGNQFPSTFEVELPLVNDYRTAFRDNGMILLQNVSGNGDWRDQAEQDGSRHGWIRVSGDVALVREEDGTVTARTDQLRCTCAEYRENNYHCRHTRALGEAAIARSVPPQRTPAAQLTPEERQARVAEAQARIEAAAASDWTRNENGLADARKTWQANSEVTYSENFAAFNEAYAKAQAARAETGKPVVPYLTENALGGLATRESGQAFGVEIEYDFPPEMSHADRAAANQRIGVALKAAGLTSSEEQQPYHASANRGYTDKHTDENGQGTWSWERDGTVAGELVTPGMYDEPETWEKLNTALNIIKANGGIASANAGAHVHVGTGFYGQDTAKYAELARLMTQHEDVMYRLAANPERGTHRGMTRGFTYASPAPAVAPEGFVDANAVKRWQGTRTRALNFNGVRLDDGFASSHPEFRIFDASLDAGTIQSQVKVAVAMTHAAARNAANGGTARGKEEMGAHAERLKARGRRRPTEDDLKEETATFRSLMDSLFTRAVDKEQVTAVFANTNWVKLTTAQRNRRSW